MFYDTVQGGKIYATFDESLAPPATRRDSMIKISVTKPLCFKVVPVSSQPNHQC